MWLRTLVFVITLVCSALQSALANESDWRVIEHDKGFALANGASKYPIDFDVGTPRYLQTLDLNDNFSAVVYASGDVGTSTIIRIKRALLFNGERYLGNVPYSYINLSTNNKLGPTWTITANKIVIVDDELGGRWVFEHQHN